GPGVAVVEPVRAARFGRDDDRAAGAVAELRLVAASEVLVVVRRQRVQEQRHPVAPPRHRPGRNVDGIGLEDALVLARAVGAAARRPGEAVDGEIRALRGLELAHQDSVHGAGLRYTARLAGQVVVDRGGELCEVDVGVQRADVARGARLALVLVAPPGRARGGARGIA